MTEDAKGRAGTGEAAKGRQNAHKRPGPVKRLEKVVLHCRNKDDASEKATITYYMEPGADLFNKLKDGHIIIKAGKEYRLEGSIHSFTEAPAELEGHIILSMTLPAECQKDGARNNYLFTAVVDAETKEAYNSKKPGVFYALLDDYVRIYEASAGDPIKFTMKGNDRPAALSEYLEETYKRRDL